MKFIKNIFFISFILSSSLFSAASISNLTNSPDPIAIGNSTTINFTLSNNNRDIMIGIWNETGVLVRKLIVQDTTTGAKSIIWDGKDDYGNNCPKGIYKAKILVGMNLTNTLNIQSNEAFSEPTDLAVDADGNLYVADSNNNRIHKISKDGTHLWVKGSLGSGGTIGGEPEFDYPRGIAVDKNGYIYVSDMNNGRVQKLNPDGTINDTDFAQVDADYQLDGTVYKLRGLDCNDTFLYIIYDDDGAANNDGDNVWIREIRLSNGSLNKSYRNGTQFVNNDASGYEEISDVVCARGMPPVANDTYIVVSVPSQNVNSMYIIRQNGTATLKFSGYGNFQGLAIDSGTDAGNRTIFAVDANNNLIYKMIWDQGTTLTISDTFGDNEPSWTANNISLNSPKGIAYDSTRNYLWVADTKNNRILRFNSINGEYQLAINSPNWAMSQPKDIAGDSAGFIYVCDYINNRIHKFNYNGEEQEGWPKGKFGNGGVVGGEPEFNGPFGIAIDSAGFIFVTDQKNGRIQKLNSDGTINDSNWANIKVNDTYPFNVNNHCLRGLAISDTFLYYMFDDDLVNTSNERIWLRKVNLNTKQITALLNNVDWGKLGNNKPSQSYPIVNDLVIESTDKYLYITNADMPGDATNSNVLRKVQTSNGTYIDLISNAGEVWGIAIDEFDVLYITKCYDATTGSKTTENKIYRYYDPNIPPTTNPSTLGASGSANATLLGLSSTGYGYMPWGSYGAGTGQMNRCDFIYYDKINKCFWVSDSFNNRLMRWNISYDETNLENYEEEITIENPADTPQIIGITIYGNNVNYYSSENKYYLRDGDNDTLIITFNVTMDTSILPEVVIVFANNYETTVTIKSYITNTWIGTFNVPNNCDGIAKIRVSNARGSAGQGNKLQTPNPDESKTFVVDATPPAPPVIDLANPTNTTSNPIAPAVQGSVNDANPDIVHIYTFPYATNDTYVFSQTNIKTDATGKFAAVNVLLQTPAPSVNYIAGVAVDKAGNISDTSSPRILVNFLAGNPGVSDITPDPDAGLYINDSGTFFIKYTAAENITVPCTVIIYIPDGWTPPQNSYSSIAGYVRLNNDSSNVSDITIKTINSGETFIIVTFSSMTSGGYFIVNYGDTQNGLYPGAVATITQNANLGENVFIMQRQKSGSNLEDVKSDGIFVRGRPVEVWTVDYAGSDTLYKGQTDKKMLEIYLKNLSSYKTTEIVGLILDIEDTQNNSVIPSSVISKIIVKNSTLDVIYVSDETIEASGKQINLTFSQILELQPLETKVLELFINVPVNATGAGFRIDINDSGSIIARNKTNPSVKIYGEAKSGYAFNAMYSNYLKIATAEAATDLKIQYSNSIPSTVSKGQTNVRIMSITFVNPIINSAAVKINTIKLKSLDAYNNSQIMSNIIGRIKLQKNTGSPIYINSTTIPNSDSIVLTPNDLRIYYNDTLTIDVYADIKLDATSDSFKFSLFDSSYIIAVDANVQTNQCTVTGLTPTDTFPMNTDSCLIQLPAKINVKYISISETTVIRGNEFNVNVYIEAENNRANAYIIPSSSDLKFIINGSDSTTEFNITSYPSAITLNSGSGETLTYTVKQNNGFSTGEASININTSAYRPLSFDFNDYFYGAQSILSSDTDGADIIDTITITNKLADVIAEVVADTMPTANYQNIVVLKLKIVNNSITADSCNQIAVNTNNTSNSDVKYIKLWLDQNKNDIFEPAVDTLLNTGAVDDGIETFINLGITINGSDYQRFFITYDLNTNVTDSNILDCYIPANGISLLNAGNLEATQLNSSGTIIINVIAKKLSITPQNSTAALGTIKTLTLSAVDEYGNIDLGKNISVSVTITDSYSPSAYIYSTTPSGWIINNNQASGNLSNGVATVSIFDATNIDTVNVALISFPVLDNYDTALIVFNQEANAAVYNITPSYPAAGETDILILDIYINNPALSDTITTITINSLNTNDSDIYLVKLFVDSGAVGFNGSNIDSLCASAKFNNGTISFTNLNISESNGVRIFITYDLDTQITDNNYLDAYIPVNGITLATAGQITNEILNSGGGLSQIRINASQLKITPSIASTNAGVSATKTISAIDKYGNIDKDYSNQISISKTGSAFFVSTTLSSYSGIPAGPLKGYLINGEANFVINNNIGEIITLTATSVGISETTAIHQFNEKPVYVYITSITDNYDTYNQQITINGTAANVQNGDSVFIYLNTNLQCTNIIYNDTLWTGTAFLNGFGDSLIIKIVRNAGNIGYETITVNFYDTPNIKIVSPENNYSTNVMQITINGTAYSLNKNDSLIIYNDFDTQYIFTFTSYNQNWSGTTILNEIYDTIIVKAIDRFSRTAYDTIIINYDTIPPSKPINLSAIAILTGINTGVYLKWTGNSESDSYGYNIYRDTDLDNVYEKINNSIILNTTTFLDTNVIQGETYIYKISCLDLLVNESSLSDSASAPNLIVLINTSVDSKLLPGDTFFVNINFYNNGFSFATNPIIYYNLGNEFLFDTNTFLNNCNVEYFNNSDSNWYSTPTGEITRIRWILNNYIYPANDTSGNTVSVRVRLK
ncbi:MAG TPA: FlgD immunoglobulin-like domain containing protein [bacterium]|nr:FlgD immunoglobulin-like domain containing protein [bacterium]HOL47418.1 FlgD immunoglobulin-like domain containing protein [bacterium]HPQ19533.1 FlgD immunoglobulin-like domain containing protein [bacterium]